MVRWASTLKRGGRRMISAFWPLSRKHSKITAWFCCTIWRRRLAILMMSVLSARELPDKRLSKWFTIAVLICATVLFPVLFQHLKAGYRILDIIVDGSQSPDSPFVPLCFCCPAWDGVEESQCRTLVSAISTIGKMVRKTSKTNF